MPHTDCRIAHAAEESICSSIEGQFGIDTQSLKFRTTPGQIGALHEDVLRIFTYPLQRKDYVTARAICGVSTDRPSPVEY